MGLFIQFVFRQVIKNKEIIVAVAKIEQEMVFINFHFLPTHDDLLFWIKSNKKWRNNRTQWEYNLDTTKAEINLNS